MIYESFEDFIKGKSDESKKIISELIKALAKEIMTTLDTRREGALDVSYSFHIILIVVLIQKLLLGCP